MVRNEGEVIIKLGAEGGSLTLYGVRTEQGWSFMLETIDQAPKFIDEESFQKTSGIVDSWDAALELLDRYRSWPELYPLSIHPDFRRRIREAVQKRWATTTKPWLKYRWLEFSDVSDENIASPKVLRERCRLALSRAFIRSNPDGLLDAKGYTSDPRANLVHGVHFEDVECDFLQGGGGELRGNGRRPPKFLAAHSSAALAVNVFGPFKRNPLSLRMPWADSLVCLHFERKCPHGVGKGNPPNLDVVLQGPHGVIGVESKCLEPIGNHKAAFRPAYDEDVQGDRRKTTWFREMQRLSADPTAYCRLDAAQLVKHALGLSFSFPGCSTTLAYFFWEPLNAEEHPLFSEHRLELQRFAAAVAGDNPIFVWMAYRELWNWWDNLPGAPVWLRAHVDHLRERYELALD
jgi:hypothetical protein